MLRKNKIKRGIRTVIYGASGIGKTTFTTKFPNAVFMDLEHGADFYTDNILETPTNKKEVVELKITGFEFGYSINDIDKIAKITLS